MRTGLLTALMLLVGTIGLLWSSPAYAEGSKELMTAQGGDRAYLDYRPTDTSRGGIPATSAIRVYAKSGETINLGSSAQGLGNSGGISYRKPDGTSGQCARTGGSATVGRITSRNQEMAGPTPNAGGYTPCVVTVGANEGGIWEVTFVSPVPNNEDHPEARNAGQTWQQPNDVGYVSAWDITVRSAAGAAIPGRAYLNALAVNTGMFGQNMNFEVFVQTYDGYRYRLDLNGLDPWISVIFANNKGFRNATGNPSYRSIAFGSNGLPTSTTFQNPSSPDTATDVTHKMFVNTPAGDLPETAPIFSGGDTWLKKAVPAAPTVSNFSFVGAEGTYSQAGEGLGGDFVYDSTAAGNYSITLDINNDGTYGNANDRFLFGVGTSGTNRVRWDGKDGNGVNVATGSAAFGARVKIQSGEVHFPTIDAEGNPNGNIFERQVRSPNNYVAYYNDSGLSGGTPPNPLDASAGVNTANPGTLAAAHAYGTPYGDNKAIDTWAFTDSNTINVASQIEIKSADLAITKTDNQTNLGSGDPISYDIKVTNNGPSAVTGATLTDAIPTGISNVSWSCAVTTGTGNCGTANGSTSLVQTSLNLANGAVATITVNGTVTNDAPEILTNTANVARPNDVADPNSANNSATDNNTRVNRSPRPQNDTATTNEDTGTVIDVRANDLADPDAGQTLTITNVSSPQNGTAQLITSGADAGKIRYTPNANSNGADSFTYTLCDNGTPQRCAQATVNVTVTPANDKPVVDLNGGGAGTGFTATFTEDGGPVAIVGANALSVTDVDDANIESATVTLTNRPDGNSVESLLVDTTGTTINASYNASSGVLSLTGSATKADYQRVLRTVRYANTSENPSTANRSITFTVNDGDVNSDSATSTVTVQAANDRPIVDLNGGGGGINYSATFTEDGAAVAAVDAAALSVTDVDDTNIESATITLTNRPDANAESLLVDTTGTSINASSYNAATGVLTLTGSATKANYQQVLRTVRYRNTSQAPDTTNRVVEFTVNDGDLASNVARSTISVTAVNDAPVAANNSYSVNEDVTLTVPDGATDVLGNDTDAENSTLTVAAPRPVSGPTNGTLTLNANGSFTYMPNANFNGTDSFTYRASDGAAQSNLATVTITVNPVNDDPIANDDTASANEDGNPVNIDVLDNDTDGPDSGETLSVQSVTQPPNGKGSVTIVQGQNGNPDEVRFTPSADFFGQTTFEYTISDGNGGTDTATVAVNVANTNDDPIANDDTASANEGGNPVNIDVLDNDTDGPDTGETLSIQSVTQPPSGEGSVTIIQGQNGNPDEVRYTPSADFFGTTTFEYTISDGNGGTDTATVTVDVANTNDDPVAVNDTANANEDGNAVDIDVLDNDTDGPDSGETLSVQSVTQPPSGEGSVTIVQGQNGNPDEVRYTPSANFFGQTTFEYTISDGNGGTDTATVTVNVANTNDDPIANGDTANVNEDGNPINIDVLGNDTDGPDSGETLSIQSVTQPPSGEGSVAIIQGQNGNPDEVRYTPSADFFGQTTFEYTISDGNGGTDTATVAVNVANTNDDPIANDDTASANEDGNAVDIDVLDNDTDGPDTGETLSIQSVTQPPNGEGRVAIIQGQNGDSDEVRYTPSADFFGQTTFEYTISDGNGGTDIATVTINVTSVNDTPVAEDDTATVDEDDSVEIDVLTNDRDADGNSSLDPASVTVQDGADHGTTTVDPRTGEITYTPNADFNGTDSFTYEVCDKNQPPACSNAATVTVTITSTNDAPEAEDKGVSTPEDTQRTIALSATDVDGDDLSFRVPQGSGPAHGTLGQIGTVSCTGSSPRTCTAEVVYTPNNNYNGPDEFEYVAEDANGATDTATVDIDVAPVNDDPNANDDSYTVAEDGRLNVPVPTGVLDGDTDIDGDSLTAALVSGNGPTHGTLTLNPNGSFTYNPNANYNGPDSFTYRVSDGKGGTDTATVSITVSPINDAPNADDESVATPEDTSKTIEVLDGDTDPEGDTLTVSIPQGGGSAHGSVTVDNQNRVVYTPNNNYNGPDSFTYRISDGKGGTDTATVTINVTPVNDAPVAREDSYDAVDDNPLVVSAGDGLLDNDTDVEGNPLVAQLVQGPDPSEGTLTLNPNGSFSFDPATGFEGQATFTYRVCEQANPNVCSEAVTVTINVAASNDGPMVRDDRGSTGEAAAVGNAFISQYASPKSNIPTRLYQFNTTQSPYTLDKVGADIARPMNAIGYRSTDLSLYGYRMVKSPGIVKVDPETGAARYLGKPSGLPTTTGYIAGDVSPDGSTYYLYANKAKVIWKVDLATFKATSVKLSSAINVADFAVSPTDGNLYGVAKDGKLLRIDPRTGGVTSVSVSGLKAGTYGAAWFTSEGSLIVYENGTSKTSGTLVWISRPDTTPSVVSTKPGPSTRGNDGAAYVADPDAAGLSVMVDVLANDSDPDGALDRNTLRIVQQPANGTVTINSNKTITYTSGSSYRGTDSFRYEVCDNDSPKQCGTATVNITSEPITNSTSLTASRKGVAE